MLYSYFYFYLTEKHYAWDYTFIICVSGGDSSLKLLSGLWIFSKMFSMESI